jgi:CheY-like chemotaxis protein
VATVKGLTNTDKKTILIVDDEEKMGFFFLTLLKWKGYNVENASNGQEAVDAYKSNPDSIDLILMDISMPVMSGIEAYRELKQYDPTVPIILMSGYTNNTLEGFTHTHFIKKPMKLTDLFNTIEKVLEDSAVRSQSVEND